MSFSCETKLIIQKNDEKYKAENCKSGQDVVDKGGVGSSFGFWVRTILGARESQRRQVLRLILIQLEVFLIHRCQLGITRT